MNKDLGNIPWDEPIPILYEDNHLLVVQKPAGLLTQGDDTSRPNLLDLTKEYIKVRYQKPGRVFLGMVHRLDRPVAGVIVLARTSKAASRLSEQFRQATPHKVYLAVVHGRVEPEAGWLEATLVWTGMKSRTAAKGEPDGRWCRLSYRTVGVDQTISRLEVTLETGRRHQIRAQLAAIGHPIVGDRLYGSPVRLPGEAIGLWAARLSFLHPTQGERLSFESLPGPDWPGI
jgi:23S rRNA pseudouridine1911/1915/1917 synthase